MTNKHLINNDTIFSNTKNIELDSKWIDEFEKIDNKYEMFYTEDINYVSLHFIYINSESNIQAIKEEKFFMMKPNLISREEVIGILKKNSFHNNKRYTVLTILKYNFDLAPPDVEHFLSSTNTPSYLSVIKNIDEIPLNKTIEMFQDLNDILILFYEKPASTVKNGTKRVYLSKHNAHRKTLRQTT